MGPLPAAAVSGKKTGLFELAESGTLFLDEVGELSPMMQAKLLRVLESGEFRRVGGTRTLYVDVRVVCATNRDLWQEVCAGAFREDLYYRIACLRVHMPSLQERSSDIPILSDILLTRIRRSDGVPLRLTKAALGRLQHYHFPGNIRELRNILSAAVATCGEDGWLGVEQIEQSMRPPASTVAARQYAAEEVSALTGEDVSALAELEARQIARILGKHEGNRRETAAVLGISVRTLYRKLHKYGLH
jgi:DNA-binding NtrC family response regulator